MLSKSISVSEGSREESIPLIPVSNFSSLAAQVTSNKSSISYARNEKTERVGYPNWAIALSIAIFLMHTVVYVWAQLEISGYRYISMKITLVLFGLMAGVSLATLTASIIFSVSVYDDFIAKVEHLVYHLTSFLVSGNSLIQFTLLWARYGDPQYADLIDSQVTVATAYPAQFYLSSSWKSIFSAYCSKYILIIVTLAQLLYTVNRYKYINNKKMA